ncbi:hypothetical protein BDV26DRAFT_80371 [Aspergillus bertholletiae]|uniref:Uncharacterized protein n=1 Tax=Aspergillus bertholletiae TaxID=1226010 RepID=A0A5N7AUF0_9EURO|nr:hypothetical protein BDV26DRAFT_80371 [Aspergillus bertholletiae]
MIPFLQLENSFYLSKSYSWRRGFSPLCLRNAFSLPTTSIQSLEETTLVILTMLPRLILRLTAFIFTVSSSPLFKIKGQSFDSALSFVNLSFSPAFLPRMSLAECCSPLFYLLIFCCPLYTWMGEANALNFCMSRSERFNYVCFPCSFFVVRLIEDAQ